MANKRICVQIDFNGPNPLVIRSNGTFDKRLSLLNLAKLLRGVDNGSQFRRPPGTTSVVVQDTLVQASGTITPAAVLAADTFSIGGQALTATQGRASGTVTAATVIAGNTFTINGQVFTAVNGAVVLGEATFDCSGTDAACATSIAAQVNAYGGAKVSGVIKAKAAAAVVTLYATQIGTFGNAFTLTSSGATLAVSGATLANGAALANNQFDFIGTNAETGTDMARAVNASTTAAVKQVAATVSAAGVVTVTSKTPGVAGNAIALASSNGARLAVSAATLTAGAAGAPTQWTF